MVVVVSQCYFRFFHSGSGNCQNDFLAGPSFFSNPTARICRAERVSEIFEGVCRGETFCRKFPLVFTFLPFGFHFRFIREIFLAVGVHPQK